MGKPEIHDMGRFYRLTKNGPEVDKERGTGKVLTSLLAFPGQWYSREDISGISGWNEVQDQMRVFSMEINAWMRGSYRIEHRDQGGTRQYRLVEVKGRKRR